MYPGLRKFLFGVNVLLLLIAFVGTVYYFYLFADGLAFLMGNFVRFIISFGFLIIFYMVFLLRKRFVPAAGLDYK
ncbi:MAG: hypothetical protein ABIJ16_14265 [Bacteroidota bacterium]